MNESRLAMLWADGSVTTEKIRLEGGDATGRHIKDKSLLLSHFTEVSFKGAQLEDCVFRHSYFERCYFRKATLDEVDLTHCIFRDCNFDSAVFINCRLDYAEFSNCSVKFAQLQSSLPKWENTLRELARNLRVNAQDRGEHEDYRMFLLQEMKASRIYNFKKMFGTEDFYKKKYPSRWDRVAGFVEWIRLIFENIFWGYGEVPTRVIWTSLAIIVSFAFLYWELKIAIRNMPSDATVQFLWFSLAAFVSGSYGDLTPAGFRALVVSTAERGLGLIMFGFFVTSLYRRISKR